MTPLSVLLLGAAGACVGSFATNLGLRLASGEAWARGRSRCEHCARSLPYVETLPLLAYAGMGGRCAGCRSTISPVHPLGEIAGAVLLPAALALSSEPMALLFFVLAMTLLAAAIVDLKAGRLPIALSLVSAGLCIALTLISDSAQLAPGIVAALAVVVAGMAIRWGGQVRSGAPGLGLGDIKLMAALGLWLGAATPLAVALAASLGLAVFAVHRPGGGKIRFGPCIALAALAVGIGREFAQGRLTP